ncbi:hypothetical protein CTRI78_v003913 [Colletotrichum trifolii]|uniref:Uncharacterized protein n=1 Tax=Colletotrichum trifolii TaxID=5466 RepID=A0A4V3HWM7_COLTR|nr:hypothetical protein CTRI78_v003913 [Colletotrichum trifolii]
MQQPTRSSPVNNSLTARIISSATQLSTTVLAGRPESDSLRNATNDKAQPGPSSAPRLAPHGETASYRDAQRHDANMGGAFKYSTESPSAKEQDYGHFMAAQIDPDSSEPISTPPVKGIGKQAQDSCSAIDEQEARDGLSVVDILKGPDGLHDFDETADDGQALLSPQEESTLREALFGASAPGRAPDWTGLLDFQPGYLQPSRRNENDGDLRYHYGDIDSQSARALWMDSWNEVLQSYTDQVWGELGSLAREARLEVAQARDQGDSGLKALERLRQILAHLRAARNPQV